MRITGLEAEMRAIPTDGLDLVLGFGFVDAEFSGGANPLTGADLSGNQLSYSPNFSYNLAAQYRAPFGLFARIELQGAGTTFLDDTNILKEGAFAMLNLRLGYEFDDFGIYVFGNNVTDVERTLTAGIFPGIGTLVTFDSPATVGVQIRNRF